MEALIQLMPLAISLMMAIGSGVAFIAARRERAAMAENVEMDARKKIFDSYGDLVARLEHRVAQLEEALLDERQRRRELETELENERKLRKKTQGQMAKILERLTILENENRTNRGRIIAVEAENGKLRDENARLRQRLSTRADDG